MNVLTTVVNLTKLNVNYKVIRLHQLDYFIYLNTMHRPEFGAVLKNVIGIPWQSGSFNPNPCVTICVANAAVQLYLQGPAKIFNIVQCSPRSIQSLLELVAILASPVYCYTVRCGFWNKVIVQVYPLLLSSYIQVIHKAGYIVINQPGLY